MTTKTTNNPWIICQIFRLFDHLDQVDLYMGRFRVPVTAVMIGYIILHAFGFVS